MQAQAATAPVFNITSIFCAVPSQLLLPDPALLASPNSIKFQTIMATESGLPQNVHISKHPCLTAKLSQLRSRTSSARDTKTLVHEIALIVGCEALATATQSIISDTEGETPLGFKYPVKTISPNITLVPILRSGLGMLDALQTLLPSPTPVHHLGLFRDPTTLAPVEYYNNLTSHLSSSPPPLAILLDPVIATGGTAVAAIQTLLEWGVEKVVLISVLGSKGGIKRAAEEGGKMVEIWVGGVDEQCDDRGMIVPGLGDVGDRLYMTLGS